MRLDTTVTRSAFDTSAVTDRAAFGIDPSAVETPSEDTGPRPWLLAYTKPRQEAVAELNLARQGFEVYLPLFRTLKRGAPEPVLEPMFPRYVFLRPAHAEQSVASVRSTRGVMSLVRFGVELGVLPDQALQCIREVEQLRMQASVEQLSTLKPGQKVCIADGPLKGLEGLVQSVSSKRVVVLLELLGRVSRVGVEHRLLMVA